MPAACQPSPAPNSFLSRQATLRGEMHTWDQSFSYSFRQCGLTSGPIPDGAESDPAGRVQPSGGQRRYAPASHAVGTVRGRRPVRGWKWARAFRPDAVGPGPIRSDGRSRAAKPDLLRPGVPDPAPCGRCCRWPSRRPSGERPRSGRRRCGPGTSRRRLHGPDSAASPAITASLRPGILVLRGGRAGLIGHPQYRRGLISKPHTLVTTRPGNRLLSVLSANDRPSCRVILGFIMLEGASGTRLHNGF